MTAPRFHPLDRRELQDGESGKAAAADLAMALAAASELEKVATERIVRAPDGFTERVWAAIESEPLPAPATAAGEALRSRRPHAFVAALGDARRVAFGGERRPVAARSRALALLLAAALAIATLGGVAAAGAARVFVPPPPVPSPVVTPPITVQPSPEPSDTETPEPTESAGESETPQPSARASQTVEPIPSGADAEASTGEGEA